MNCTRTARARCRQVAPHFQRKECSTPVTLRDLRWIVGGRATLNFYEFPLSDLRSAEDHPHGVSSGLYRKEDAPLLKRLIEAIDATDTFTIPFQMGEVEQRLKEGHLFYVAKRGREIIGYCWYLVHRAAIPGFNAILCLGDDQVCPANVYIKPELRGMGIRTHVRGLEYHSLMESGYQHALSYVNSKNKIALKMHRRLRSHCLGTLTLIRILTLSYYYSDLPDRVVISHGGAFMAWKKLYHELSKNAFRQK